MTRELEAPLNQQAIGSLALVSIVGGVLGILAEAFSFPVVLLLAAAGLFGMGVVGAAIAALLASRKTGSGFGRSLFAGIRFAARWIWELAP